jgi:hypothetical protein
MEVNAVIGQLAMFVGFVFLLFGVWLLRNPHRRTDCLVCFGIVTLCLLLIFALPTY